MTKQAINKQQGNNKESESNTQVQATFCLLNTRSVRNKTTDIREYITEKHIDCLCITETWLTESDTVKINNMTPIGYTTKHQPREGGRVGGVAVVFKNSMNLMLSPKCVKSSTFEYMETIITSGSTSIRLVVVYRPPPSRKNKYTTSMFLDEFPELLEKLVTSSGRLIITGDFNLHVDTEDKDARRFLECLESFNLQQHVNKPTHRCGHTLDLVITHKGTHMLSDIWVSDDLKSDHFSIIYHAHVAKPAAAKSEIIYRKLKNIDMQKLLQDMAQSNLASDHSENLEQCYENYNTVLKDLLDIHAPQKKRVVICREKAPWLNQDIWEARRK